MSIANDQLALGFNDWIPTDADTWHALNRLAER